MAKKPTEKERMDKEKEFKDLMDLLDDAVRGDSHNRELMREDISFRHGDQWDEQTKRDRITGDRPVLTFNKMEAPIDSVVGEFRQKVSSIKVLPLDENPDVTVVEGYQKKDGSKMKLSNMYEGLIKSIEAQSSSRSVYTTALDHTAGHGLGWIQIVTAKRMDNVFQQELRLRRIKDPLMCYIDPNCDFLDGRDAMYGFVAKLVTNKHFKKKWPKKKMESVQLPNLNAPDGYTAIAIVYTREIVKKTVCLMSDGTILDKTEDGKAIKVLIKEQGLTIVKEAEGEDYDVEWKIISGGEILERGKWDGRYIPLVPVYGKELVKDGKTYRRGVIRHAKDAQRLYNLFRSTSAERADTSPKAPYLVAMQQINHEDVKKVWDDMATKNLPYLPYLFDGKAPIPQRQPATFSSQADIDEIRMATDDIKAQTGVYDASLGAKSNETSGRAILARKHEGDTANFAYDDNLSIAQEHVGRILVDMIPRIYDTEQVVRVLNIDDTDALVRINQVVKDENGKEIIVNDLSKGRFEVRVTTGASYATQKMESVDSQMAFISAVPDSGAIIGDIVARNSDWAGGEEIANRLAKTLPKEFQEKDDDEEQEPPPPPTPEQEIQAKELEIKEMELKVQEAELQLKMKEIEQSTTEQAIKRTVDDMVRAEMSKQSKAE